MSVVLLVRHLTISAVCPAGLSVSPPSTPTERGQCERYPATAQQVVKPRAVHTQQLTVALCRPRVGRQACCVVPLLLLVAPRLSPASPFFLRPFSLRVFLRLGLTWAPAVPRQTNRRPRMAAKTKDAPRCCCELGRRFVDLVFAQTPCASWQTQKRPRIATGAKSAFQGSDAKNDSAPGWRQKKTPQVATEESPRFFAGCIAALFCQLFRFHIALFFRPSAWQVLAFPPLTLLRVLASADDHRRPPRGKSGRALFELRSSP